MTIDEFMRVLEKAAPDYEWRLERQEWYEGPRLVLRAKQGDFKTELFGAICHFLGKGMYDAGNYCRSAAILNISRKDRREISFAYNSSPLATPGLKARILASVPL